MDSPIVIPLLIHDKMLHCPRCGGIISGYHTYGFHSQANSDIRSDILASEGHSFEVTLVCGDCEHESRVNDQGLRSCIKA